MDILNKIITCKRLAMEKEKHLHPADTLQRHLSPPQPLFKADGEITLIAECKKASPSSGLLAEDYNPVSIAADYEQGGADALSVLTEAEFFLGTDADLIAVKKRVGLPVLRKDFIIDSYQIKQSWAIGADAVLLIAAALSFGELQSLCALAHEYGLQVLAEAHDKAEVEKAVASGADAVGINARNLYDFSIDLQRLADLRKLIPAGLTAVAESGLKSAEDGQRMYEYGFRAFLVGGYFMTAPNRRGAVRNFKKKLCK